MYLMSATCYANLCGTTIIKCKLGRQQQIFPALSHQRGAVLLSSQNEFCRDYCCNHSLHVWLSFQQQKKKPHLYRVNQYHVFSAIRVWK